MPAEGDGEARDREWEVAGSNVAGAPLDLEDAVLEDEVLERDGFLDDDVVLLLLDEEEEDLLDVFGPDGAVAVVVVVTAALLLLFLRLNNINHLFSAHRLNVSSSSNRSDMVILYTLPDLSFQKNSTDSSILAILLNDAIILSIARSSDSVIRI